MSAVQKDNLLFFRIDTLLKHNWASLFSFYVRGGIRPPKQYLLLLLQFFNILTKILFFAERQNPSLLFERKKLFTCFFDEKKPIKEKQTFF